MMMDPEVRISREVEEWGRDSPAIAPIYWQSSNWSGSIPTSYYPQPPNAALACSPQHSPANIWGNNTTSPLPGGRTALTSPPSPSSTSYYRSASDSHSDMTNQQRQMENLSISSAFAHPSMYRSHSYPESAVTGHIGHFYRNVAAAMSNSHEPRVTTAGVKSATPAAAIKPTIMSRRPITGSVSSRTTNTGSGPMIQERSDSSDEEGSPSHPNKYAVAVEEHKRPECRYKRQASRSGNYVKVIKDTGESFCMKHNPSEPLEIDNGASRDQPQIVKYYRKDLVRVCRCGEYTSMEHMLDNSGRANDAEGYEIHYSQKCKWKFFEDFKTKKRVLIRLCKCYKPAV